jgi:hypothetical protein
VHDELIKPFEAMDSTFKGAVQAIAVGTQEAELHSYSFVFNEFVFNEPTAAGQFSEV